MAVTSGNAGHRFIGLRLPTENSSFSWRLVAAYPRSGEIYDARLTRRFVVMRLFLPSRAAPGSAGTATALRSGTWLQQALYSSGRYGDDSAGRLNSRHSRRRRERAGALGSMGTGAR